MITIDSLYAIVEVDDDGNEKFFNDLLPPAHYNKTYKPRVYKNLKVAEKALDEWQNRYQWYIEHSINDRYYAHRFLGELRIKEFKA